MMANPHLLVEGAAIASYAIGAGHAFIYVRGEVLHVIRRLRNAVQEARAAGYLGQNIPAPGSTWSHHPRRGRRVHLRRGDRAAGLAGGKRGLPRNKPPFPPWPRVRPPDEP